VFEGWSNNKALEIFNPTDAAVDLSGYFVTRYSNGANAATEASSSQLTGTIASGDVYVAVIDKRDPDGVSPEQPVWDDLQAKADGFYCPVYATNDAFYWNGNDAVVLYKGTLTGVSSASISGYTAVDIFGKIGENPEGHPDGIGWTTTFPYTGAGAIVSADHSLIRKTTVLSGVTNPLISFFNALEEYDSIPPVITVNGSIEGNWNSLGVHACDCPNTISVNENTSLTIDIYPNPNNGEFSIVAEQEVSSIEIISLDGKVVQSITNLSPPRPQIPTNAFISTSKPNQTPLCLSHKGSSGFTESTVAREVSKQNFNNHDFKHVTRPSKYQHVQ
jgi:hypothetical protein